MHAHSRVVVVVGLEEHEHGGHDDEVEGEREDSLDDAALPEDLEGGGGGGEDDGELQPDAPPQQAVEAHAVAGADGREAGRVEREDVGEGDGGVRRGRLQVAGVAIAVVLRSQARRGQVGNGGRGGPFCMVKAVQTTALLLVSRVSSSG